MRGQNPVQDGAILPVANGPPQPELLGNDRQWQASLSFDLAGPLNFGRGVLSASNKPSEVNIGNMPVFFTAQFLNTQVPTPTRRLISRVIPGG